MLFLSLVVLALLATVTGLSGPAPVYVQGQWIIPDEHLQYEDLRGVAFEDGVRPASPPEAAGKVTMEDQTSPTTTSALKEPGGGDESTVWKVVLVVAVLLVSLVGSLSVAYYLCVWRGGRIYYQPQKEGCA